MSKINIWRIASGSLVGALILGLFLPIIIQSYVSERLNELQPAILREFDEKEKNQLFLYEEVLRQGLIYRDFFILKNIAQCESNWTQFKNRELVISKGNIGLFQINRLVHEKIYIKMGLNMSNPFDNIKFAIYLYKRNGIKDWRAWSGHCFMPRLTKK